MDPRIGIIVLSPHYSPASAIEAIQRGACDYLMKPVSIVKLVQKISELLSSARLRRHSNELDCELVDAFQVECLRPGSSLQSVPPFEISPCTGIYADSDGVYASA